MTTPMSEEKDTRDRLDKVRIEAARGFAAFKILLDERTSRIDRAEKKNDAQDEDIASLRERIATLEERLQNVKEDVTGRHDVVAMVHVAKGKEEAVKEIKTEKAEERKLQIEKWKASAPIYVAIVTAFGALVTGIVNLVLHLIGSGGAAP